MKLFPRLAVNKTILKPRFAAATGAQYLYMGFSRRNKILCCSAYDIRVSNPVPSYRHTDYNPDRVQKLISSSMSRQSTRNISFKSMHAFLSNLANRQTDKQIWANAFTSSFVGGNKSFANYDSTAVLHIPLTGPVNKQSSLDLSQYSRVLHNDQL